jgi:large subunit ribosomal protein L10
LHTLIARFEPPKEAHMDNPNPDKVAKVAEIAEKLGSAGTVLVADYRGLDVPAQAQLREAVRTVGGEFKIYKNTLTRIAAERTGVDLGQHLFGPTALAFAYPSSDGTAADPVGLSKVLVDFATANPKLEIKGGVVDGNTVGADEVTALSKVPPREEMLAKFAGLLQAPMAKFAGLLQAMPQNFAGLLKALIDKGGTGAEAPAAAPEAAVEAEAPAAAAESEAPADAPVAEDAAETPASDEPESAAADSAQTEEPVSADSEETDDKED